MNDTVVDGRTIKGMRNIAEKTVPAFICSPEMMEVYKAGMLRGGIILAQTFLDRVGVPYTDNTDFPSDDIIDTTNTGEQPNG